TDHTGRCRIGCPNETDTTPTGDQDRVPSSLSPPPIALRYRGGNSPTLRNAAIVHFTSTPGAMESSTLSSSELTATTVPYSPEVVMTSEPGIRLCRRCWSAI